MHVEGCEDLGCNHRDTEHEHHRRENYRQRLLALALAAGLAIAREHGDEGDRGGAADQKVGDRVRQLKHRVVGVRFGTAAEQVHDVLDADQADDLRQQGRGGKQKRSGEGAVAVRGAQHSEGAPPG